MEHYVYRITNIITGYHYSGSRSAETAIEDIGHNYFSSSTNKLFIQDQKNNPDDYVYKIVFINEEDREKANLFEEKYHKRLDVRNNIKFINKTNANSNGYCKCNIGVNYPNGIKKRKEKIKTGNG